MSVMCISRATMYVFGAYNVRIMYISCPVTNSAVYHFGLTTSALFWI